jgi:hypothetical protein
MVDLTKAFETENGIKVGNVIVPDSIVASVRSSKPTFSGDLLTVLEFYNSLSQINANRIAKSEYTYSGEQVITQVNTYYQTDGVTVHATETISFTYTGDEITKIEVS